MFYLQVRESYTKTMVRQTNMIIAVLLKYHAYNLICVRRNNLDICSRRISRRQLSTANEDIRRTKEIFENFHGPNLKREGVVKGLVGKIMEENPSWV